MWDLGLYIAGTEAIVQRSCSKAAMECEDGWLDVPDVLAFYDYVGHNPAKGGLFRVGAMNSGTSPAWAWLCGSMPLRSVASCSSLGRCLCGRSRLTGGGKLGLVMVTALTRQGGAYGFVPPTKGSTVTGPCYIRTSITDGGTLRRHASG